MLSDVIGIGILVAGFAVILERVRLVPFSRDVVALSRKSVQTLRDPGLSDDEKERITQANTLSMIRLLVVLIGGTVAALGFPLFFVWVLDQLGLLSLSDVLHALTRWDVLVAVSVVGVFVYWATSKWRAPDS